MADATAVTFYHFQKVIGKFPNDQGKKASAAPVSKKGKKEIHQRASIQFA